MSTTVAPKESKQQVQQASSSSTVSTNASTPIKLPDPISKETYLAITDTFCNAKYGELTSMLPNLKNSFEALHSLRTLDCKLCFIMLLLPQFHNDALRQLDNILNLYRNLNLLKTKTDLNVKYAEDHSEDVVAYLVDLRVSFVLHQMALVYYQRSIFALAVQLFLKSASVARSAGENRKKVLEIPEDKLTEDEKFDLNSTFTKNVEIYESEGLHMAGLTYRFLASSEEFYSDEQKTKIYESAVKLQEKALESAEGIEYKEARERGIAQASFELGMCHLFMEKDEALAHFDKCLEHTDDETLIENCNFHKILYYRSKDDMDNSLEMYNKLKHNKNAMLLSSIYMNAKNYDKALEIIEEDLKEKESAEKKEVQDQFILFQLYQHLAHVRLVKKNISEALTAANAAETILNAELKDVGVDPAHLEKQQDIFKAIYVEQQQYAKVLSFCIHNLANPQLQEKVSQQQIEEILPQFAVQSKKSLLFLTETMEPESPAFYIFLMTPTGKLYFARSTTSISIEGYAQKAVQSLQDESKSKKAKKEADKVLEEMYKHFITPIKEHIPEDAPLAIVTHLFQIHALSIPFAALKNPETGKHLAEEYCVELTPLQFIEQIEKIQETKEKPAPAVTKPEKPQLVVVAAEKTSAEIQRFQKIVKNKKLDCEMNVLAKPKKKAVLKELKSAPGLMYFMTGDNLENDQKEAPTQFGLQLNRSELLIPKDDLKKNYAPDTTMPDACLFGHVSGAFAFCQYAHYFLQSGANHVVGFKLVVREKLDDKILLNEEIYPRFFQAYVKNGQDASKAYREVMQHLIANHDRMTWSSFAMVSRVTPLPKKQ